MKTRKTYLIAALLLLGCGLLGSCAKDRFDDLPNQSSLSFQLKTSESTGMQTKSNAQEHDIKGVYLLIFDRFAKFLECRPATFVSGDTYAASVGPQSDPVTVVAVANVAPLVESRQNSWVVGSTTYGQIASELLTEPLRSSNGVSIAMPELAPLFAEQVLARIDQPMVVATPFVLERATAKLTITVSAPNFSVLGANLYNVPTQGYVLPKQPAALSLRRAPYMGSAQEMISTATEADPLYCYETPLSNDPAGHPFLVIKSNRGYYRINLTNSVGEQLSLQRNCWYRINLSKVISDGYPSADEAIRNPPLNVDIVVTDPNAHEIISNGVDYLGLSNSEYIIYDSYALNEFNFQGENNRWAHYDTINGYVSTILTYESRTAGEVTCVECTTASKGTQSTGISFRDFHKSPWDKPDCEADWFGWYTCLTGRLLLPATTGTAVSKKVIINIPHDFTSGKIKITLGTLEREVVIQRRDMISVLGDVLDMGPGYSTASIDFEKTFQPGTPWTDNSMTYVYTPPYNDVDLIQFSNTPNGGWQKTLLSPSDNNLYVKVSPFSEDPNALYKIYPMYSPAASEFYLTRAANQSRTKVHLIREPFVDRVKDNLPLGSGSYNYCAAFWKNDQSGERIIKTHTMTRPTYWTARVLYGKEFIRINHLDGRTAEEIRNGNAEDYQPDATWKTFLEQPYTSTTYQVAFSQFRIGLTSKNTTGKPRYGLVLLSAPYGYGIAGMGQSLFIFVRQGEEAEALFSTSDTYQGAPRNYAQAFSPYLLTAPDPANHPGGPNFSDHKRMNGRGVFTRFPTQQGYIYQWGNDRAIHPSNPKLNKQIVGYAYDYLAPYQEICPPGYTLPLTDEQNITYAHSFIDETNTREQMGGLCADGYFDRFDKRNTNSTISVGADGPELGVMGAVYYNTKTLASIFISDAATRPNGVRTGSDYINDNKLPLYWGRVVVPSSPNTQALIGRRYSFTKEEVIQDRKGAFSVRCVKIDARHESGSVSTPGGGDYKPWN